ncbi:hypothetical protein ADUPG1_006055 [Aduncisulcus paluster]|uniref:Reverse transcriptase domain-containing protein n=1 Tax=Aduncisulcus paluster TaxID=2918883 RepID=A0ABQ5KGN9_9EUKA|nr:hypothetical protein ADUPG1_006055 [Aduncisulcus paluster]
MRFSVEFKEILDDTGATKLQIAEAIAVEADIRIQSIRSVEDALEVALTSLEEIKDPRYLREEKNQSSRRRGKYCSYCKKKGHDIKECRKKQRDDKNQVRRMKADDESEEIRAVKKSGSSIPERELECMINGIGVVGLADTGTDCNLIHPRLFERIRDYATTKKLCLPKHIQRDGRTVSIDEEHTLQLTIRNTTHPLTADFTFFVSDIINDYDLTAGDRWLFDTGIMKSALGDNPIKDNGGDDELDVPELTPPRKVNIHEEIQEISTPEEHRDTIMAIVKRHQRQDTLPLTTLMKITKETLDKLLEDGLITRSESDWASPIVLVRKKNTSLRLCVDYRRLNRVIRKPSHIDPNMEMALKELKGNTVFGTLDFRSGFHQVSLAKKARKLTAFTTPFGTFKYTVMPFGIATEEKAPPDPLTHEKEGDLWTSVVQWRVQL